jgi:NAD+ synthase
MGVYDIGIKMLENEEEVAKYTEKDKAKAKLFLGGYAYPDMISALYGGETSTKWKLMEKLAKNYIYNHFAFQDTKVKLRMVYLYFYAKQHNYAVIGTSDKSEYSIGLYIKYGDGANDIQILRHLYKTQLKQLARYMGLPPEIINKPHSGDLYANAPHTDKLGMSYEELDMVLLAMDKGYSDEKLAEIVPKKGVDGVKQLIKVAALIKRLPLSVDSL